MFSLLVMRSTLSPKTGQGMNVSMGDTYSLGWKIGLVLNCIAKRSIVKTYQSERRRIAQDLIAFDHGFSRLFSGRPAKDAADEAGILMTEFKDAFEKRKLFASGLAVDYGASILVAKAGNSTDEGDDSDIDPKVNGFGKVVGKHGLATNMKLGMRFPSFQVLNQADAIPSHFAHLLKSDGRFRIVVFAGDLKNQKQWVRVQHFAEQLAKPESYMHRFTPPVQRIDSVIEILMIHSAPRQEIELLDLHEVYHPFHEKRGWDYEKVYVDDASYHEGHGEAYKGYGVDADSGYVVIVRPDQYVGWVGELEDLQDMDRYFSEILIPQN